jgi:hypothetical protein
VDLREFVLENFAGDLEYHPRRAGIYLILAAAAGCFWIFSPAESKFRTVPLLFALGSLTLLGKGVFLLRPSSEGIGLSHTELAKLATSTKRKKLPSVPTQVAQVVQDFGTGGLLLWPLLNLGIDIDRTWSSPPRLPVFAVGAFFFSLGWTIRRFTQEKTLSAENSSYR